MITFQELIKRLTYFWEEQGCIIHQGYDLEVGAGTFNPVTFLRCLGPEPYHAAYIEPSRRPGDGRYGENPNRLQHYFQYQVVLKPSPPNMQQLYMNSLKAIGLNLQNHDIRFVHDDWESPTLGAWGLGWEVWLDGMEVTQFTYFQSVGGVPLSPITGELTYGIERLAMYLQKVDSIYDLQWNEEMTYGDIYHRNEVEWSHYNFEKANVDMWWRHFDDYEAEAKKLMEQNLPLPAYDFVMKASHAFNLLDARGAISVTERTGYIARIRNLSCSIAESYIKSRESIGFPLLEKLKKRPTVKAPSLSKEDCSFETTKKDSFVLEIGSEELPATFVPTGCQSLEQAIRKLLDSAKIPYGDLFVYGTPRRLTVLIENLSEGAAAQQNERKGPPLNTAIDTNNNPSRAGLGFFRSLGIEAPSIEEIRSGQIPQVFIRNLKGVDYLFAHVTSPGISTAKLLCENLPNLILSLTFPKTMSWGDLNINYARPLRWILALFGNKLLPFSVGDVISGQHSFGHAQLMPGSFIIEHADTYLETLRAHKVLASIEERKQSIVEQIQEIEKTHSCRVVEKEKVLAQVLHLVEWPQLTVSSFDKNFLRAPKEVLISEMVEHQKYFPLIGSNDQLLNQFVITADNTPSEQIRQGNTKVISARLADGVFLYEQDLSLPLESLNEKLKAMTFQKQLGSVYDKVQRLVANTQILCKHLPISDQVASLRAALLCKADLSSELVGEFPDLQGIVGRLYAQAHGEDPRVCQAIDEHWMPRGENAPLPQSPEGMIISLSEKIDNLISCFSLGLKPTSSSDPYALRRQALGFIKILIQERQNLSLGQVFDQCFEHFCQAIPEEAAQALPRKENLLLEIKNFFSNRIKTVFQDYGLKKDEVEASLASGFDDIFDSFCRAQALHDFRKSNENFPLLFEVYKRAKGQLAKQKTLPFAESLLKEEAELALHHKLSSIEKQMKESLVQSHYDEAYLLLAQLQAPLATFFDQVRVLADDESLRFNRLSLLQRVFNLFEQLLDFGKLQEKLRGKAVTA